MTVLPITDAHQHLWNKDELELPWLESVPALNRSFTMAQYLDQAAQVGVTRSVYVEVDVAKGREDDELSLVTTLAQAPGNPLAGVVAPGNPSAPDFRERVRKLSVSPFVKGVRQVLHTLEQPKGLCLQPSFVEGVRLLGRAGLSFDVCMRPTELQDAAELARRCPETTLVIDHCGNAAPDWFLKRPPSDPDERARIANFKAAMEELAALRNTVCKLSGIAIRLAPERPLEDLGPTLDFCVSLFGYQRCMVGSDWPVCTLRTDLGPWLTFARAFVDRLPEKARAPILSQNAERVYRLA